MTNSNRWVKAVLWHPEATFIDERSDEWEGGNIKLLKGFIEVCKQRKEEKQGLIE